MQSTQTRYIASSSRTPHRRMRRLAIALLVVIVAFAGAIHWRDTLAVRGSDASRHVIGTNNTLRLEAAYFRLNDRFKRLKYQIFGGNLGGGVSSAVRSHASAVPTAPPATSRQHRGLVAPPLPTPVVPDAPPPSVPAVFNHALAPNEGIWQPMVLSGPLRTQYTARHPIYTTVVRPDPARPYASVTIAEFAPNTVTLHPVAGTSEPGTALGVAGAGLIPPPVLDSGTLLGAFNGGFRWVDGHYGMIVDGTVVSTMQDGLATLATYRDGSFRIGAWGTDITATPDLVSARQNGILLIDRGAISPQIDAGGKTWGFVWYTSRNFYTTRSAVGIAADGRLVFAAGYEVNARSFATALHQAGIQTAMQLDVNRPYTQLALYEAPKGVIQGFNLTDWMGQSPQNFFAGRARDFVYMTIRDAAPPTPRRGPR